MSKMQSRRRLGSSLEWALWCWKTHTATCYMVRWAYTKSCFLRFRRGVEHLRGMDHVGGAATRTLVANTRKRLGSSLDWALWHWKMRSASKHVAHWAHMKACFARFRKRLGALSSRKELRRIIRFDTTRSQWLLDRRHAVAIFSRSKQLAAAMANFRRHAMLHGAAAYCFASSSFARLQRRVGECSRRRHKKVITRRLPDTTLQTHIRMAVTRTWRQWCRQAAETRRFRGVARTAKPRFNYYKMSFFKFFFCSFFYF